MSESNAARKARFRDELAVDLVSLGAALTEAGYMTDALFDCAGLPRTGGQLNLAVASRRTSEPVRLHVLARLFFLGQSVARPSAQAALQSVPVESLMDIGLLQGDRETVRSVATIVPYRELFILHDYGPEITGTLAHDHVVGAGEASLKLAALVPRPRVHRALDLGCGSGVQAIRLAQHADEVVATDLNPRALSFTRMTAGINGLTNIETRLGSLFEPLAGESFDLVASNPPFAVSPRREFLYRDSGAAGDALARQVVEQLPSVLNPGGWAVVMFSWTHDRPDDWPRRPQQWTCDKGVDAWLLKFETLDALGYAIPWLSAPGGAAGASFAERLDEWVTYYERLGIRYVSTGAIVLRRRAAARNFYRADDLGGWGDWQDCGRQIERVFANQTRLDCLGDDEAILDLAPALADEHELIHAQKAQGGQWVTQRARVLLTHGLKFAGNIDPVIGALLANCDGSRTIGALVADFCRHSRLEPRTLARPVADVFRKLFENGLVELPSADPSRSSADG